MKPSNLAARSMRRGFCRGRLFIDTIRGQRSLDLLRAARQFHFRRAPIEYRSELRAMYSSLRMRAPTLAVTDIGNPIPCAAKSSALDPFIGAV